jgi:hypothetical protein
LLPVCDHIELSESSKKLFAKTNHISEQMEYKIK